MTQGQGKDERSALISEAYKGRQLPLDSSHRAMDKDKLGFTRPSKYVAYVIGHEGLLPVDVSDGVSRRVRNKAGKWTTQLDCVTRRNTLGVPVGRQFWADSRLVQRPTKGRTRGAAQRRRDSKRRRLQLSEQHTTPGTPLVQGTDRTSRTALPVVDAQASKVVKCSECGSDVKAYGGQDVATCSDCKSE